LPCLAAGNVLKPALWLSPDGVHLLVTQPKQRWQQQQQQLRQAEEVCTASPSPDMAPRAAGPQRAGSRRSSLGGGGGGGGGSSSDAALTAGPGMPSTSSMMTPADLRWAVMEWFDFGATPAAGAAGAGKGKVASTTVLLEDQLGERPCQPLVLTCLVPRTCARICMTACRGEKQQQQLALPPA
jgi:hypothetical protein